MQVEPFAVQVPDGIYSRTTVHEQVGFNVLRQFLPLHDHRFAAVVVQGGVVVEVQEFVPQLPPKPVPKPMPPDAKIIILEQLETPADIKRRDTITEQMERNQRAAERLQAGKRAKAAKRLELTQADIDAKAAAMADVQVEL